MRLVAHSVERSQLPRLTNVVQVLSGRTPLEEIKMSWQVPIAVNKGTRPSIPEGITLAMMGLWNTAQECWSQNPWDRPSFLTVLDKLDAFARTEDITPFALREPRPMQVKGKQSRFFSNGCAKVDLPQDSQPKLQRNGKRS